MSTALEKRTEVGQSEASETSSPRHRYTPEEYLSFERGAGTKHEYVGGEILAMVGASEPHVSITVNVTASLRVRFKGRRCKVYSNDMRLKIGAGGMYAYPDVMALCGDVLLADDRRDTLENPQVVIEVLSRPTEDYDRGEKFDYYKRIPSLTDYLLVAQDRVSVEHRRRSGDDGSWAISEVTDIRGRVSLPSIGCELPVADIYEQVDLPA